MLREKTNLFMLRASGAILVIMLLAACAGPAAAPTATQPAPAATLPAPTAASAIPTAMPTQAPEGKDGQGSPVTADVTGVAQSFSAQEIAAVSASGGGPIWDVLPQYTALTLTGYPQPNTLMKPQIFIYPAKDLAAANEAAGKIAVDLQALLQNQQADKYLPFLPMYNAAQVMHAQVKYLDFKNGKGVRYLTEFDQAPLPINNHELIYTYQGLSSDGKYYVAAVLPVTLPSLPADEKVTGQEPPEFKSDFLKYVADTVSALNQQPASAFTPDLGKLDAMIQSIELK